MNIITTIFFVDVNQVVIAQCLAWWWLAIEEVPSSNPGKGENLINF